MFPNMAGLFEFGFFFLDCFWRQNVIKATPDVGMQREILMVFGCMPGWKYLPLMSERLTSLGMMGDPLNAPLNSAIR